MSKVKSSRDACPAFTTKDGSTIRELLAPRNSLCERMSLAEATLPAGTTTACHMHPVSEELYYFLAGTGRILIGDELFDLAPGDAFVIRPGVRHQTWSTGRKALVFLCHCAPSYEHEDTVILPGFFPETLP